MKTDLIITKTKFRLTIVLYWVSAFLYGVFDAYDETSLAINDVLYQEAKIWELSIFAIILIIFFSIDIGLLMFKVWARKLYIYSFFLMLFSHLLPSLSWTFYSGFAGIFYELGIILSTLIWGILIVPSLYQPLFEKRNSEIYEK